MAFRATFTLESLDLPKEKMKKKKKNVSST